MLFSQSCVARGAARSVPRQTNRSAAGSHQHRRMAWKARCSWPSTAAAVTVATAHACDRAGCESVHWAPAAPHCSNRMSAAAAALMLAFSASTCALVPGLCRVKGRWASVSRPPPHPSNGAAGLLPSEQLAPTHPKQAEGLQHQSVLAGRRQVGGVASHAPRRCSSWWCACNKQG